MNFWLQDLTHAVRRAFLRPGTTLMAAFTLSVAIGATTTLYSVFRAVVLAPLPYADSEQLVKVMPRHRATGTYGPVDFRSFVQWRDEGQLAGALALYRPQRWVLDDPDGPRRLSGAEVSAEYFATLAVDPMLGRPFGPEDFAADSEPVALVRHDLWQQQFGASPGIIGRQILLDGSPVTVVGVVPRGYSGPRASLFAWGEIWTPLKLDEAAAWLESPRGFGAIARLGDGDGLATVRAKLEGLARQLEMQDPDRHRGWGVAVEPLEGLVLGDSRETVMLVFGAVSLLLLMACVNVAHLVLARAPERQREVAVRRALGASAGRMFGQLLNEGLILAVLGGTGGLLLASWGIDLLPHVVPSNLPRLDAVTLDRVVLWVALGLSLASATLASLMPAWVLIRRTPANLRGGWSVGRGAVRSREWLVAGEVAVSLVLVVAAGLLLENLWRLQQVDLGFDADQMLMARVEIPTWRYPEESQRRALAETLEQGLAELPRVEASGLLFQAPPLEDNPLIFRFWRPGDDLSEEGRFTAGWRVSSGYRGAMGIPLVQGRFFEPAERSATVDHLVVNRRLAEELWPGESAVGQILLSGSAEAPRTHTVIGVVGDVRYGGPAVENDLPLEIYAPWGPIGQELTVMVRGPGVVDLGPDLRTLVQTAAPGTVLRSLRSGETMVAETLERNRFAARLLLLFAVLATGLAALGIHGVMGTFVTHHSREIGIRMALGARARQIHRWLRSKASRAIGLGLVLGLVGIALSHRTWVDRLVAVEVSGFLTVTAAILLLVVVAALACWWPMRRAIRIDPVDSLRWE